MSSSAIGREQRPLAPTLEVAYRMHVDDVWRLTRLLGVDDAHLDDVVHDVFLVVQRRLPDFDPTRSLKHWITGITRNLVMHYRRSFARRTKRLALVQPAVDTHDAPDDRVARAEAGQAFATFVEGLDDAKREVFVLFEVEDLSARAIAEMTGININTVFTRLRAAREQFERFIAAREAVRA